MVFLWFSYGFPMVFLWFSYGFPMVFLWFSYGFPMVFLWFSMSFDPEKSRTSNLPGQAAGFLQRCSQTFRDVLARPRPRQGGIDWDLMGFTLWLCQNSYGKSPFLVGKLTISMENDGLMGFNGIYPLVKTNSLQWKMAIEIVSFPIKHGDFP